MLRPVIKKIGHWYKGEFVFHKNDPNSGLVFMTGNYKRHWTATVARALVEFWLAHWKWIIASMIAVAAIVFKVSK